MEDFEIVDKNILDIDSNEHNFNSISNPTTNYMTLDRDIDFSIISVDMKNEDVRNLANNVESDCTSPLSIENIDLDNGPTENINNSSIKYDSYPLTILNIPFNTLDASEQNIDKRNEKEILDKEDEVNLIVDEEKENKRNNNKFLENSEGNFDSITENVHQTNIKSEDEKETKIIELNQESPISIKGNNDTEDTCLTNSSIENDDGIVKLSDRLSETVLKENIETNTDNSITAPNENELLTTKDESDFRVNIIESNDADDKWSTNEYIHNDNIVKQTDNLSEINRKNEEKDELDSETKNEIINNADETDFRVNIIERNNADDKWSTNAYIHNDNIVKQTDNLSEINGKNEEKEELNSETKNEIINNADEPDFRVNIIDRNDADDKWSISAFEHDSNVNKEISPDTEKSENQSINTEINSSNLEVLKSDSLESSDEVDTSNKDENDLKNNELINSSNGNENDENVTELNDDQRNENETILSDCRESMNTETNDQSECRKLDISEKEVEINVEKQLSEPVVIRPLHVDDPTTFPGMSALIHVLFNCVEFRMKMIEYHNSDQIAYFNVESNPNIKSEDLLFINDLCKLFVVMKENKVDKIREVAGSIRNYFRNLASELNVDRGFNYILEKINAITRTVSAENNTFTNEADVAFFNYKCQNKGFVSDLLSGQIMNTIICGKCQKIHERKYEQIKYLSLKIPNEKNNVNFENCIKNLFSEVKIETSQTTYNCCAEPDVKLNRQLTHIPEYLFIYIDRKLENNERDKTFIETDTGIFLEGTNGSVLYSLHSVIDEIFVSQTFFNYVKCLSDAWWSIDYMNYRKIAAFEVISENSIGFMLKKQIY